MMDTQQHVRLTMGFPLALRDENSARNMHLPPRVVGVRGWA